MIRQPIIAVMGHVDHGKTSLLDRIRNSTVAAKEAGGITQHIGASEIPIETINDICGPLLKATNMKITIPGLLFIDTPGHEAFTNLRVRGGSVADIAILVVDITKGFEPQTIEAVEILKQYKTPFIIAANKVDLLTGWHNTKSKSIVEALKQQNSYIASEIDSRIYELIGKLSEFDFNSELFNRVKDFQKELAIVPLSAKTGEGIAELLMVVTGLAQRYLEEKLKIEIKGPGKGSILEKKEIKGLGITIDVILYDGTLHINDTIAFATPDGIGTAKIKALLKPKSVSKNMDSGSGFNYVDFVSAASGVKISCTGLDDAIPGSPVMQVTDSNYSNEIKSEIGEVFKTDNTGIILKADTIGSIDAISKLLKSADENFKISKKEIGKVTKRDIMDAFAMYAKDPTSAVILAFNVGLENDAVDSSDTSGVKIIQSNIIYKLIDDYKLFVEQQQRSSSQKIEDRIVFPASIEVIACFRASHPLIIGISVMNGRIKPGYRLITDQGIPLGKIKGLQNEKTPLQIAKKGDQIALSIEGPTFGRQVKERQMLYVDVTEEDYKLLTKDFSHLINDDERKLLEQIREIKQKARE
ncbi:MAG: translation initiation factor IF-2 [Candidatus Micrarchaeaceae archaeon]|jgi:translation initiation factor 5B